MPEIARPLLIGGERLKEDASNPVGRSKTHRFTYVEAQERLLPQIRSIQHAAATAGARRTPEFVFRATLWPDYLAASFFPDRLFAATGIEVVGSAPATLERPLRGVTTPSLAKALYLSASDDDLGHLQELVAESPPPEGQGDPEDSLWNAIRTLAVMEVPTVDSVLRLRAPLLGGDQAHTTAHSNVSLDSQEGQLWECVLHSTPADAEALALFERTVREVGGETRLDHRLLIGGLIYASAFVPSRGAREIAALNPLRVVRPMPVIRPVFTGALRAVGASAVQPPPNLTPATEHRVAVFDGGVDSTCPLVGNAVRHIDLTPTAATQEAVEHGSVVTNALLFGYVSEGRSLRQPEFGVDHYRVWPPPHLDRADPDLFWVLRQILGSLSRNKYRIVVLCLAPEQEVDDGTPHPWTAALDEVAREMGILFVVAAGNGGDRPADLGLNRVQVPADMINGLGVGASTARAQDRGGWNRASYSSQGPGRPGSMMQPMVMQFGGTPERPFYGIGPHGSRVLTAGTSFAAPLVGHAVASALAAAGPERGSAHFLRALAVHTASRTRPHFPEQHGYGLVPERFDDAWQCAPNAVTLLYSDTLERKVPVAFVLPVPDGLPPDLTLKLTATVSFETRVDPRDPVDYGLSSILWTYRPHMRLFTFRNRDNEEEVADSSDVAAVEDLLERGYTPSRFPRTKSLREFSTEQERRSTDGKWETVIKAWGKPTVADLYHPRFEFRYLAREHGRLLDGTDAYPLPFSLLVTLEARPDVPLYQMVRSQFQVLTPIQLDARIQV